MSAALHIDDIELEDYVRRNTPRSRRFNHLSQHLAACPECRTRAIEVSEFVGFLLSDPAETAGHIHSRHWTPDGTLFLVVNGSDATSWDARILGAGRDVCRSFQRGAPAKAMLERWFHRTFPGHRCTNQCGGGWK